MHIVMLLCEIYQCWIINSVCFAQSAALLLRGYGAALLRCYAGTLLLRCCCALLFAATLLRAPAALLRLSVFLEE